MNFMKFNIQCINAFKVMFMLSSFVLLQACGGGGSGGGNTVVTYSISGTVIGLNGSALTLRNNDSDSLTITDNGNFIFVTELADSSDYVVNVFTHPSNPNQFCSISNATGVIDGAHITDVNVVCEDAFSISGSVTGLVGSGLILQNNAGDDLGIGADGSFTFSVGVLDNASYSVTVITQPSSPNQFCSIVNASGQISSSDVSNVSITCETSYTIKGSVNGLMGSGLVLQNNNGDDLVINANGNFSFNGTLLNASQYSVSVLTNPLNLSQQCSVVNGTGTLNDADVTDITINCVLNTFSVGGSVTGLLGSGLALQNNAVDSLELTGGENYTFATALDDGSDYDVSILTQPSSPNQICSVTNNSGTLSGTNVSNADINCITQTYTISGTVSGLLGTNLVLQNNAGDNTAINSNGSFSFQAAISDGANYLVTVFSQPQSLSQQCVVNNANGTLSGSNISNVTVTCITNSFNVGVNVTGLAGSGLVLQNNGGDNLAVSANGDSNFITSVTDGGSYAVTILNQPTNLNQTCTVTNASGVIAGFIVSSVNINCVTQSYTINGTVTGLQGTNLILQNNSDDNLVIDAGGSFSFSTALVDGSDYLVTVLTDPTNLSQICTASNASGTLSGTNISNIVVNCVTNQFNIGGTVSGLAGSGLVLQNNASNSLSISQNGAFNFSTKIDDGSTYSVSVFAQPSNLNQICSASLASGNLSGSDITNVNISCVTTQYSVGGVVSDFQGSGMVLQNNAGDNLTINANGAFTFNTPVVDGGVYSVSVLTQPSGTAASCSVINGNGTIQGTNTTSVSISCVPLTADYYFSANDGVDGVELWKTNGSDSTTVLVKNINPTGNSSPQSFVNYNGAVYFVANDGNGTEIWKTSGAEANTIKVTNIRPNTIDNAIAAFDFAQGSVIVNNKLFFSADDGVNGRELWSINSSDAVTLEANIDGAANSYVSGLTNLNGIIYFSARTTATGSELWRYDDNAAGTKASLVRNLNPGSTSSSPGLLTVHTDGNIYFRAKESAFISTELYVLIGSTGKVQISNNISPIANRPSNLNGIVSSPIGLFYRASTDNRIASELHRLTSVGTESIVKDINVGTSTFFFGGSGFDTGKYINSFFYFPAYDGTSVQIWKTNGSTTTQVTNSTTLGGGVGVIGLVSFNPNTNVTTYRGSNTEFVADKVNGLLYFRANSSLWVIDTATDTSIQLGTFSTAGISGLTLVGDSVYFYADDESGFGQELWRADQTPGNAVMVRDINEGAGSSVF